MASPRTGIRPREVLVLLLGGLLLLFYFLLHARVIFSDIDRLPFVVLVPLTATVAFVLSLQLLGWPRAVALLLIGTGMAFTMEWIGERTGIIYGPYCYTDLLGWKIGGRIPLIIPFAWYMMLLPSYLIANLLGEGRPLATSATGWAWRAWMAALSAALLTAWDLTMDPIMSIELAHEVESALAGETGRIGVPGWRWITAPVEPGACAAAPRVPDTEVTHFGVPWSNYQGWMLTGFLVFLAFRSVEHRLPGPRHPRPEDAWQQRLVVAMAISIYAAMSLIDTIVGSPKVQDIHLISPFAMGVPAATALMLLFRRRTRA